MLYLRKEREGAAYKSACGDHTASWQERGATWRLSAWVVVDVCPMSMRHQLMQLDVDVVSIEVVAVDMVSIEVVAFDVVSINMAAFDVVSVDVAAFDVAAINAASCPLVLLLHLPRCRHGSLAVVVIVVGAAWQSK